MSTWLGVRNWRPSGSCWRCDGPRRGGAEAGCAGSGRGRRGFNGAISQSRRRGDGEDAKARRDRGLRRWESARTWARARAQCIVAWRATLKTKRVPVRHDGNDNNSSSRTRRRTYRVARLTELLLGDVELDLLLILLAGHACRWGWCFALADATKFVVVEDGGAGGKSSGGRGRAREGEESRRERLGAGGRSLKSAGSTG